ncbi:MULTISPECIES: class I SAM-dependent methyltransferase [unclassified Streptomyces]|uniref:class I SAM-dependent methyltransferase n=1 Tax=unclassified Streptomyces TaxID=2593676 RepID=UPI0033EC5B44
MTHLAAHHHSHDADAETATDTATDVDQSDLLDLDADVLAEHIASLTAWLPLTEAPRRVVDLGSGTGTGTLALLDRFPGTYVTAVDSSDAHLRRLREKAEARGVGGRVRTVLADLDTTWPELDAPDLVWASASLHHMADPARVLRQVHGSLAPGGLLAVVELAGFPRFLPADAPEEAPGLEERCHAATEHHHAAHMPHRGADWGPLLTAAGFTVEAERTVAVDIDGAGSEAVGRYALEGLRRIRGTVDEVLSPTDIAALDRLLEEEGPHSILNRTDLKVHTERQAWAARA